MRSSAAAQQRITRPRARRECPRLLPNRMASCSRKAALAGATVPTLVIHGDVDPLVRIECGIDVAHSVPGAKLVIVEGMGHALPISMWPQIIDAIASHAAF